MTDPNNLTPPPELVLKWLKERYCALPVLVMKPSDSALHVATQAARWGADQELEACCALMDDWGLDEADLRAARRPQPEPTLRERALAELDAAVLRGDCISTSAATPLLRRALELVPEGPAVTPAADAAAAPDRPLWEAMHNTYKCVYLHTKGSNLLDCYREQLRVVADWLEQREPYSMDAVLALRAEAERAEAGE